jgi:hypothetical protein
MAIFDRFKQKGIVAGQVVVRGLPPHKMYSASITFFKVYDASSHRPFGGNPPVEKWMDTESVKEAEEPDDKPLRFRVERASGFYYLGVSFIVFLERGGKMFAQVERFFPMTQPCHIHPDAEQNVQLEVTWPDIPFDELHSYGTIHPKKG